MESQNTRRLLEAWNVRKDHPFTPDTGAFEGICKECGRTSHSQEVAPMETTQTHTPGPWEVSGGTYVKASAGAENPVTGETWGGAVIAGALDTNWRYASPGTMEANARLIAAAPDLLAALKAVRIWLTAPAVDPETIADVRANLDTVISRANAS